MVRTRKELPYETNFHCITHNLFDTDYCSRSRRKIAKAVMPLPPSLRAEAAVVRVKGDEEKTVSHKGPNRMMCRADDPAPGFMVICYHDDLDLYYTLAAPISADGALPTEERDFLLAAAEAGKLTPVRGGILYLLNGTFVENPLPMSVIFIPNLTSAASRLANVPNQDQPWLIWEGTPLSNVMMPGK